MTQLPFSQSCENNKHPILDKLRHSFADSQDVLEIGSGTGQHAVFFADQLPHLTWQPSEQAAYIAPLKQRLDIEAGNNVQPPIALNVGAPWPCNTLTPDAIFSANTLHIMSQELVVRFFDGVDKHLQANGNLCVYGPFNYDGQFTSESNRRFDSWLKQRDLCSGIRDIEWIVSLAQQARLALVADHPMPANNRLLHFRR